MSAEETAIKRVEKNLEKVEKKVDSIETAIRGTGNPHGGLFGKIEGMEGKFTTLDVKIDGVEKALIEKIDGVREIFVKMSGLFKWFVGIVTVPFCAIAVPIFIEIVLPIIKKWMGFSVIVIALAWTDTTAQAQLHINIYPSIDNPTSETIWIFGGSSSAHYSSTIRSEGNYHARDSWKLATSFYSRDFYTANKPTNAFFNLTPLFSSTNNQRDIESVKVRQASAVLATGATVDVIRDRAIFSSSTNTPTVTTGSGSKTIGSIFMNDAADDEIGIRHTGGSNL